VAIGGKHQESRRHRSVGTMRAAAKFIARIKATPDVKHEPDPVTSTTRQNDIGRTVIQLTPRTSRRGHWDKRNVRVQEMQS
jgi:hypothetical protein